MPNVIELVESFEDEDYIYIVMKFEPAGNLGRYLRKQPLLPLNEEHLKKIFRQIASGVQTLHNQNIVHRDIKLGNIVMSDLSENACCRIIDFGVAFKLSDKHGTSNTQIGTIGYIAPEVYLAQPYSFSIDIWSLGTLMHVLASGELPFSG